MVKQISVFLENKSGRLAEITRIIGEAGVNIRALSVADTSDFGVLRFIASDTDTALAALKGAGFTATATRVVAAEVPDQAGGLASLLEVLSSNGVNVEYLYAFFKKTGQNAVVILRVEDRDKTLDLFEKNGIKVLTPEEVYSV
jgi:hypothetical protein